MEQNVRILGIVPYEGMKTLLYSLAEEYPQVSMNVFVGNMEKGEEIAEHYFHTDYDVILSRGGAAKMLQGKGLPVVEVEISLYDVFCALRLSNGIREKVAMVAYANITISAKVLCDLLNYHVDIFTVESLEALEPKLRELQTERYDTVLCDMTASIIARRLGFNAILITSGVESLRKALEQTLSLCRRHERLRQENNFFRAILRGQVGKIAVLENQSGEVFFSNMEHLTPELLEVLRGALLTPGMEEERGLTKQLNAMRYTIQARRVLFGNRSYTAFFVEEHRIPLGAAQIGISYLSRQEAEEAIAERMQCLPGHELREQIRHFAGNTAPLVLCGEDGTGKETVVHLLYVQGPFRGSALVSIHCGLLHEKGWNFLLEHHNSPLLDTGHVIHMSHVQALAPERRDQLIGVLRETDVCRRNHVIISCLSQEGEQVSAEGAQWLNGLGALSLYLPPLRRMRGEIPTMLHLILGRLNANAPHPILGAEERAIELLQEFHWPHNYTQFQRIVEEAATTAPGQTITAEDIRRVLQKERYECVLSPATKGICAPLDLNRPLAEIEQDIVFRVLEELDGNQTAAAKRLGISRTTLWRLTRTVGAER